MTAVLPSEGAPPTPAEWYENPDNVAALIRWLLAQGDITDVEEAVYILEKPHKWTSEFRQMRLQQLIAEGANAA